MAAANKKAASIFSSTVSQVVSVPQEAHENFDFEKEELSQQAYQLKEKIKIKLVLVETAKDKKAKTLRKLVSPIITKFGKSPQFGMIHSALIIGPWYVLLVPHGIKCNNNYKVH